MKKAFVMLSALAMLAACSDDDDSPDYGKLTRKWYNVSERVGGETIPYDDHEVCGKDYLEFFDNGTGRFVDVFACEPTASDEMEFSWTRSGNKITVSGMGITQQVTIHKLSATTLEIKSRYDWDDDGDDDTVIERYTSDPN